jgi:hypothetical protein
MMTALEHLTLARCKKLKTLPASITHLSRLQKLWILEVPMEDMPCIEALTALHELRLLVTDYAHGSRAFTALSRSLPCLQQLQVLRFQASEVYDGSEPLVGADAASPSLPSFRSLRRIGTFGGRRDPCMCSSVGCARRWRCPRSPCKRSSLGYARRWRRPRSPCIGSSLGYARRWRRPHF